MRNHSDNPCYPESLSTNSLCSVCRYHRDEKVEVSKGVLRGLSPPIPSTASIVRTVVHTGRHLRRRVAIQALRLTDSGTGFADQCGRFVRAIDTFNGWPSTVNAAAGSW